MSDNIVTKLAAVARGLDSQLKSAGNAVPENIIAGSYSQEAHAIEAFQTGFESNTQGLGRIISEALGAEMEMSLESEAVETSASYQAGLLAALASEDAKRYHVAASKVTAPAGAVSLESLYGGLGGEMDLNSDFSMESFDETTIGNFKSQNIIYNVLASRQDAFAEAFFPTKVIPASEGGLKAVANRQEVIDYRTHAGDGSITEVNRNALIEAYAKPGILNRAGTDLVPYANPDNSADANFAPKAEVATTVLEMAGVSVPTRPLKVGMPINVLGLSSHPGLINNGVMDITDQIAPGARVSTIYLRLANSDESVVEIIPVKVGSMTRSQFRKSHEGKGREVVMNLLTDGLILDKNTKTIGDVAPTLLASLATNNHVVRFGLSLSGNGNLNTGVVEVNPSRPRLVEVIDENGQVLATDAGAGKTTADQFAAAKISVEYFDLAAKRSNTNFRTTGAIIDVTPYTEAYAIEMGNPITVLTPVGVSSDEVTVGAKLAGMINASRIRNSNNAVASILNYAEHLSAATEALARGVKADVVGIGRYVGVKPFYNEDIVDVSTTVTNIKSKERADDVSEVIVNNIRDWAWRMYRDANYGPALDMANGGVATKPKLLIGCDAVTKRYLDRRADPRLLGGEMDYEIVSTNNETMTGKIVLTFTTGKPGTDSGVGFGTHAYVPELIHRLTKTMNGGTSNQDRVVPRSIHVPALPCMVVLTVQNLSKALTNAQ